MNLKKIGKVFRSKFVGTGPSSYKNRIYRAAVAQMLRNTTLRGPFEPKDFTSIQCQTKLAGNSSCAHLDDEISPENMARLKRSGNKSGQREVKDITRPSRQ